MRNNKEENKKEAERKEAPYSLTKTDLMSLNIILNKFYTKIQLYFTIFHIRS